MIGRLRGEIAVEEPDGTLIIDVNGVGYVVVTPLGTVGRAKTSQEGEVVLQVHTHVRDDAIELFGFATETERQLFRLLLGVQKIGPKTALGMLSALPPTELARAVAQGDLSRLSRVPGVGKKTAERLVLELKEKLPQFLHLKKSDAAGAGGANASRLAGALVNMGYRMAEAEQAVVALGDRVGTEPTADLLRDALAWLTQRRGP